eukprot:CAMPEP_0197242116 /NCGR_PEP_ID=MMETSP1429-20130617/7959_1 /TAXON_ID=49237 /ORGANISM="Chaetoceros  sp., Strain UNC1202" /LENGTH=288 /DNA_ID=CAMNT_0042702079 /DNA_START=159 /DNA_END=1025 /DNA_ORIENTATION=+
MSITYEEALGTLNAMFTDPWTEESLDAVLRHFEGHMENTVDAVLAHGDSHPQQLVQRLEQSKSGTSMAEMDEQLARQLASQEPQQPIAPDPQSVRPRAPVPAPSQATDNAAPVAKSPQGRGTPTALPPDFLRIPGVASTREIANDEALARMLQDKLFADEIKNNPEFAHLARGRRRPDSRNPMNRGPVGGTNREGPPEVLKALQGMGEQAKRRFQDLATKVKAKINENQQKQNQKNGFGSGSGGGTTERRGLLDIHDDDDDEQEISFVGGAGASRPDYEMRSIGKKED